MDYTCIANIFISHELLSRDYLKHKLIETLMHIMQFKF